MKLTIHRDVLSKALRRCDLKASNTGNSALACVTLSAKNVPDHPGGLDLKATNGLVGIATMVACNTEEEGDLFINTKQLMTFVNSMPNGVLTLETGKEELLVSGGMKRRFRAKTRPLTDIRALPDVPDDPPLKIPSEELLAALGAVSFVVPNVGQDHASRLGVLLDIASGGAMSSVVIAEHMVAVHTGKPRTGPAWRGLLPEVVLPHVRELAAEEAKGTIEVFSNANFTWIQNSSTLVVFNPPPGEYMDWRMALQSLVCRPVCRLPRLAMLESLKALIASAAYSEAETTAAWVQLTADGNIRLDYQADGGDIDFNDFIPASDITATELPGFVVNAAYLRDALDAANIDPILNFVSDQQIALSTEEGFLWFTSLIAPQGPPPAGDRALRAPEAGKAAAAAAADAAPAKPKSASKRKPPAAT